jgi:hypothetical protein
MSPRRTAGFRGASPLPPQWTSNCPCGYRGSDPNWKVRCTMRGMIAARARGLRVWELCCWDRGSHTDLERNLGGPGALLPCRSQPCRGRPPDRGQSPVGLLKAIALGRNSSCDRVVNGSYLRGNFMEWFTRTTSIGGTQVPNWVLVVAAIIVIWIIYRLVS